VGSNIAKATTHVNTSKEIYNSKVDTKNQTKTTLDKGNLASEMDIFILVGITMESKKN